MGEARPTGGQLGQVGEWAGAGDTGWTNADGGQRARPGKGWSGRAATATRQHRGASTDGGVKTWVRIKPYPGASARSGGVEEGSQARWQEERRRRSGEWVAGARGTTAAPWPAGT